MTEISEATIRLHVEPLAEAGYLATSPDVPRLVAEGRSVIEAVEIAEGLTRKIVESCFDLELTVFNSHVLELSGLS